MASDDLILVIGNKNYSSWSLRAWFLLRQLGIPFREIRVPLDTPDTEALIKAHTPSGRVPVLKHGELTVWDSLAIAEYVADVLAPGRGWPADPAVRALARVVSAEMHAGFQALRYEMPMNCRARRRVTPSEACEEDIARIHTLWRDCRTLHGDGGPWLFGRFSIADAMYVPVAFRFTTYGVDGDEVARAYVRTVLEAPASREWAEAAATEPEIIDADEAGLPL